MLKAMPFLLLLGCAGRQRTAEEMVPAAKSIAIYSAGGSVISGVIDPVALGTRRLRLPATASALNLSQGNESLKWFTVQSIQETSERYKLVGLPSLKSGELKFNYSLPEITWLLQLNAAIIDSKSVSLQLQAVVNMGASEPFEHCDVTLVLNNAVSVEKLSGSTFKLNSFDLYPQRNITWVLDNKVVEYSFIREWNTYAGRDEVRVLLHQLAQLPFMGGRGESNLAATWPEEKGGGHSPAKGQRQGDLGSP